MNINEYFDHIYCVNLDRRSDKWELCQKEFAKHGLTVERVSGIDGHTLPKHHKLIPGELGCLKSHEHIFRDMLNRGFQRVLILEDDVEFIPDLQQAFSAGIGHVPTWDVLYLGGNHVVKPAHVNAVVAKTIRTFTTSSYAITADIARMMLTTLDGNVHQQIDVLFSLIQRSRNCYSFVPALAWQRAGHSDIHNVHVDYTNFMKPKNL